MKVLSWEDFIANYRPPQPLAAAIGAFDGLHLGHRELIHRVLGRQDCVKAVVTFKENPKALLRPNSFHGDLYTLAQKLETLAELGVELCVLIDFSGDFSKLAGRKFLSLLRESGDLRYLVMGEDFRCGHRLDTGAREIGDFLAQFGIETEIVPPCLWGGHPVSSSRIRKAIQDGRLGDAQAMLGRYWEVDLRFGDAAGRLFESEQLLPPEGRYRVQIEGGEALALLESGKWRIEGVDSSGAERNGFKPRRMTLVSRE